MTKNDAVHRSGVCNSMSEKRMNDDVDREKVICALQRVLNDERFVVAAKSSALLQYVCLLYTSPSPRDLSTSRMPSSA